MLNERLLDTRYSTGKITKFCLSIAGVSCAVISQDSGNLEQFLERYQRYETTGRAEYEIMVQFLALDTFPRKNSASSPLVRRVNSGSNFLIRRANLPFLAVANTASRKILVKTYRSQSCFDSFLQILFTLILTEKGGLMLPAYAINENGQVNVFFTPSGTGKNLPGQLFRESKSVTGHLGIIKYHDSRFRVYDTPFRDAQIAERINSRVELRALYLLIKDRNDDLIALNKLPAMVELYRSVSSFTDDRRLLGQILYTCGQIANTVPIFELHFRQDSFLALLN